MNKLLRKASNILKDKGTPLARDPNTRSDTSPNRSIPHNPSHNNPDADDTLECASVPYENILPQNILAFRTITTLLAKIQQDRPAVYSNALDRTDLTDSRRRELKISNALANLAIVDTDIVALVSKLTNFSDGLEVVVCGNPDGDNDQTAKPSESPPSIWDILFARNSPNLIGPLRPTDSTARQARAPTIVAAVKPAGLKSDDAKEISRYIDEDCYKSPPTLTAHLWMLSRLLIMKFDSDGGAYSQKNPIFLLRNYVIATCYPKMIRRLKHQTLSLPYINALESVDIADIAFRSQDSKLETQDANDKSFLVDFFLELPKSDSMSLLQFPNLHNQARLAAEHKPFQLYNESTYREFHNLLVELLNIFRDSLQALPKSAGKSKGSITQDPNGDNVFGDYLSAVALYGYGLQKLTRGSALRMHLRTIEPVLAEHRRLEILSSNEEEQVEDSELKAVQPQASHSTNTGQPQPPVALHESYVEWLKLMLIHFDAVDVLSRYVRGPRFQCNTIDVKILVPPPVSNDMLDWRDLFNDPKFSIIFSPPYVPGDDIPFTVTKEMIFEFISKGVGSNLEKSLGWAKGIRKAWADFQRQDYSKDKLPTVRMRVKQLMGTTVPGWHDCAKELQVLLQSKNDGSALSSVQITQITEAIESLFNSDNHRFFNTLLDTNKKGFTGAMHCEAIIASLLNHSKGGAIGDINDTIRAQLKEYGPVIGVSKRCCPPCHYLLSLLADDSEPSQYIVIGSHSTISACTLPPWLPAQIVDSMNQVFGGMLRDELVKLMRPTLVRSRATSTGSRRISSDSAEEVPEMGPPPTNRSRISRVVAAYRAAKASGSQGR